MRWERTDYHDFPDQWGRRDNAEKWDDWNRAKMRLELKRSKPASGEQRDRGETLISKEITTPRCSVTEKLLTKHERENYDD